MQRWGKTKAGTARFFCSACKSTATRKRSDLEKRHLFNQLSDWLSGKESLTAVARMSHKTRQALWKEFHPLFSAASEPHRPLNRKPRFLIVDGCYVHGHTLCALVAIDEDNHIFWRFFPYESYNAWLEILSFFSEPEIIIMDGQKGLYAATKTLWPHVPVQRCQFHVVAFVTQYVGRRPSEKIGQELLAILYQLKNAKTPGRRDLWIAVYRLWERKYESWLAGKNRFGRFNYPRLRSARLIIRRALPHLFTFLDHPGAPNTTNLVEGWVNSALAEALRLHRGLRLHEKKTLVSIVLSHLERQRRGED